MGAPRMWYFAGLPTLVLVILVAGCSGSPSPPSLRGSSGFSLAMSSDPAVAALTHGEFALTVVPQGAETEVRVSVSRARGLKAALFTVEYDPARYTPLRVENDSVLREGGGGDELLCLSVLDHPGRVYCGQVLANYDKLAGFSGDGPIAVLRFALRPFASVARTVSTPPDSAGSSIPDLTFNPATWELSWHFYNQGDYDQNGQVGLSDLAPLARFYQQSVAPADVNTAKGVADGDGNGLVTLGDIQPIGANFLKSVNGGWRVYSSANTADYPTDAHDDNGGATPQAGRALSEFDPSTNAANDRLLYKSGLASEVPGDSYWVRGRDSANVDGIASNLAGAGATDHPPVAQFTTHAGNGTGLTGTAPHGVRFDGTASYDPDTNPITAFEWDYEDDGVVDDTPPVAFHSFDSPGTYTARLTVTANGLTGTTTQSITVNDPGTWHVQTLDSADDSGKFCSLAVLQGNPAVAYRRQSGANAYLDLAVASDPSGGGLWTIQDLPGTSPMWISLAQVNNAPAVACYETGPAAPILTYTRFDDTLPGWTTPVKVDMTAPDAGNFCSLMVYNGFPRIAYCNRDPGGLGSLMFITASDANGAAWPATAMTVDGGAPMDIGEYASMAAIGGLILISYYEPSSHWLHFAIANDATPTSFTTNTLVLGPNDCGQHSSLALVDGRPVIAFYAVDSSVPYVVATFSVDAIGTTWVTSFWIGDPKPAGDLSLATIDGQPAVAYLTEAGELVYERSWSFDDFNYMAGGVVDSAAGEIRGQYCCLKEVNGHPAIAYYDATNKDLKFAIRYP